MKNKSKAIKVKKPIYKKWWFWVILIVFLSVFFGNPNTKQGIEDGVNNTSNGSSESTQSNEEKTDNDSLLTSIEGGCRALTKKFVKGAVGEDYSAFAFKVEDFEIDENQNGTIKILYLPDNAGEPGATKVNLTISINNGIYKIEYAMLSGLYEVDLSQVAKQYTEMVVSK